MKNNTILLFFLLAFQTSFCQTILPSIISQNTVLLKQNSPYIINTSTLVNDNVTLTIDPGVVITITGALNVRGAIMALGAENDSIKFHCNNFNAPSIRIVKGLNDTINPFMKFNYCSIQSNNIGLFSFNRKIEINNSTISNCQSDGIVIENGALRIFQSKIKNNLGNGINANLNNNNSGLIATDSCFINKCIIENNHLRGVTWFSGSPSGGPVFFPKRYHFSFTENTVKDNYKEGFGLNYSVPNLYIYNNKFIGNKSFAISLANSSLALIYENIIASNKGVINMSYCFPNRVFNNIICNNDVSNNVFGSNTNELIGMNGGSLYFNKNIIAYNNFENLISYNPTQFTDSLSLNNNLFFNNKPINQNQSSAFFLNAGSSSLLWDKFKFEGNNYFMDETTNFWIKNKFRFSDFIVNRNFKSTVKLNFDGIYGFYGFVYELNPLAIPDINAPISPVKYMIIDSLGSKYVVWKQNPESDLKGYKIYYGKISDFEYTYNTNVGLKNLYKVPSGISNFTDFTVTAYDKEADGNKDFFEGHESWFSEGQTGPGILVKKGNEILQSPISTCPNQNFTLKAIGSCNSVVWSNGSTSRELIINNLLQSTSFYFNCINTIPITYTIKSETVDFVINPTQVSTSPLFPEETVQGFNGQKIGSSTVFGSNSNIKLEAVKEVTLHPGFFFGGSKSFIAEIKNCQN